MRVLVVEDAPRLRAIVAQRLREDGYAVDEADTGARAIDLAAGGGYDAIVLDLRLPDIDGLEICAQLRRAGCWTPILMLTARDSLGDRVAGLDAGADDYLAKPFEFPERNLDRPHHQGVCAARVPDPPPRRGALARAADRRRVGQLLRGRFEHR